MWCKNKPIDDTGKYNFKHSYCLLLKACLYLRAFQLLWHGHSNSDSLRQLFNKVRKILIFWNKASPCYSMKSRSHDFHTKTRFIYDKHIKENCIPVVSQNLGYLWWNEPWKVFCTVYVNFNNRPSPQRRCELIKCSSYSGGRYKTMIVGAFKDVANKFVLLKTFKFYVLSLIFLY